MLNERIEFEQYTSKIEKDMTRRLSYRLLVNGGSGISRAMTIIARDFISNGIVSKNPELNQYELTIEILKAWSGYDHVDLLNADFGDKTQFVKEYVSVVDNWLSGYIWCLFVDKLDDSGLAGDADKILSQGSRVSMKEVKIAIDQFIEQHANDKLPSSCVKIPSLVNNLLSKENSLKKPLIDEKIGSEKTDNTFTESCYEHIIATAIDMGPLMERSFVVIGKDFTSELFGWDTSSGKAGIPKKFNENNFDSYVRQIICYYVGRIHKGESNDPGFEFFKGTDFQNWCRTDDKKIFENYPYVTYKKNSPLFLRFFGALEDDDGKKKSSGNAQKIRLGDQFLNDWGRRIRIFDTIDIEEIKKLTKEEANVIVYLDQGGSHDLKRLELTNEK